MTEPRWDLELLKIRVPVPSWPLDPDLAAELDAGLEVWASGVAASAGCVLAGPARWAGVNIIGGHAMVIYEVATKPKPEGTD